MDPPTDLPRICVAIGTRDAQEARSAACAAMRRSEAFVELRIDLLSDPSEGPRIVRSVRRRGGRAPILATCRRQGNGGRFVGSVPSQLSLLQSAVAAGAGLVDVEVETLREAPRALEALREHATTVASYHNFERTPNLEGVMEELEATGADVCKVATMVRSPTDNLRLLDLCRRTTNLVVAGMGETGVAARVLSPARGGLFTYVAPDPHSSGPDGGAIGLAPRPTAPGQVSASEAKTLYRIHRHQASTRAFAVIAKPVAHSKSPLIHNRAFAETGYDGVYVPMLVGPEQLEDFCGMLRRMPLAGVSVTIPHKQSVMRHLDEIEPSAKEIGAVNTLYWRGGSLVGANTDARGITGPLLARLAIRNARALVVGNGGAAKAAVVALRGEGAEVWVTGRSPERVRKLCSLHAARPVAFSDAVSRHYDILVQATPVGMSPDERGTLFPDRIPADLVFDLVYNPLETALLRQARAQGKHVISGVEMFLEQAAAQFEIWTGLQAPSRVMREALLRDLQ